MVQYVSMSKMPVSCCSHKIRRKFPRFLGSEVHLNEPSASINEPSASIFWQMVYKTTLDMSGTELGTDNYNNNSENVSIGTGIATIIIYM